MQNTNINTSLKKIIDIGSGTYIGEYENATYTLSISISSDKRIIKFYGDNLSSQEVLSGNFYKLGKAYSFRPCEIPSKKALDFIEKIQL